MNNMLEWLKSKQQEYKELSGVEIVEVQPSNEPFTPPVDESFTYHPIHSDDEVEEDVLRKMLVATVCAYVAKHDKPTRVQTTGFIHKVVVEGVFDEGSDKVVRHHYSLYLKIT